MGQMSLGSSPDGTSCHENLINDFFILLGFCYVYKKFRDKTIIIFKPSGE